MGVSWVSLEIIQIGEILCSEVFFFKLQDWKKRADRGEKPKTGQGVGDRFGAVDWSFYLA